MSKLTNNDWTQIENQYANNPHFNMASRMVSGKNPNQLEATAKNICKQRGLDLEQMWQLFKQQYSQLFGG